MPNIGRYGASARHLRLYSSMRQINILNTLFGKYLEGVNGALGRITAQSHVTVHLSDRQPANSESADLPSTMTCHGRMVALS